jgi:YcxB-like protein
MDLDTKQIHMRSSFSESTMTWEPFIRFAENPKAFILVQQGDLMFHPIPKRELTPDQITELSSLFETHLPHK